MVARKGVLFQGQFHRALCGADPPNKATGDIAEYVYILLFDIESVCSWHSSSHKRGRHTIIINWSEIRSWIIGCSNFSDCYLNIVSLSFTPTDMQTHWDPIIVLPSVKQCLNLCFGRFIARTACSFYPFPHSVVSHFVSLSQTWCDGGLSKGSVSHSH